MRLMIFLCIGAMHSDTARRCPKTPILHKKQFYQLKSSVSAAFGIVVSAGNRLFLRPACLPSANTAGRPRYVRAGGCEHTRGSRRGYVLPAFGRSEHTPRFFFIFCAAAALTQISESGSQRLKLRTEPQKGAFLSEIGGNSSAVPEIRHLPCQESRIAVHCCNACRSDCFSSSVNCR